MRCVKLFISCMWCHKKGWEVSNMYRCVCEQGQEMRLVDSLFLLIS